MNNHNNLDKEFKNSLSLLRKSWVTNLFIKQYGYSPFIQIGFAGPAEKIYLKLVKENTNKINIQFNKIKSRIIKIFNKNN